jgi:hypothetical protein
MPATSFHRIRKISTGGMTASIEYAVAVLKVPHIVVCGHTECGAMKGAMNPEGLEAPAARRANGSATPRPPWISSTSIAEDDASPDERMRDADRAERPAPAAAPAHPSERCRRGSQKARPSCMAGSTTSAPAKSKPGTRPKANSSPSTPVTPPRSANSRANIPARHNRVLTERIQTYVFFRRLLRPAGAAPSLTSRT